MSFAGLRLGRDYMVSAAAYTSKGRWQDCLYAGMSAHEYLMRLDQMHEAQGAAQFARKDLVFHTGCTPTPLEETARTIELVVN